jgi:hypothetical protein
MLIRRVAEKMRSIAERRYQHVRNPELIAKISADSLLFYYGNVHSQVGKDGVLAEIFRRLKIRTGVYVEFGAWDGIYLSNGRFLYEQGWKAVLIESNTFRCRNMGKTFQTNAVIINSMVGAPAHSVKGTRLLDLLATHGVNPEDVSFVSIDVDGPDLEIFEEIGFQPPVVILEGGLMYSPLYTERVPPHISWKVYHQQPLAVICDVARKNGYTPVCFYQDTYLVRSDLAGPFRARNAQELYIDGYNFLSSIYRDWLVAKREESRYIVSLETARFGHFSADPLGYRVT